MRGWGELLLLVGLPLAVAGVLIGLAYGWDILP